MAKYSDWRSDLREVMDDDVDEQQVKEKKVNNNKLIKINPKLGEAVEVLGGQILEVSQIEDKEGDKNFKDDAEVKKLEQQKKKEDQLKKRIIRMKLRGLNQGSGDTLVAGYEPEGEELKEYSPNVTYQAKGGKKSGKLGKSSVYSLRGKDESKKDFRKSHTKDIKDGLLKKEELELEGHQRDPEQSKKDRTHSKQPDPSKDGFTGIGNMSIKDIMKMNARMKKEEVQNLDETLPLRSRIKSVSKADMAKMELDDHKRALQKRVDQSTKNRGDLKKRDAGAMARDKMREKDSWYRREEVELDERLGGKGYSRSAMKSSIHPPSRQSSGDWEDSDRGKGNKAKRRAGEKVEKKSPTYRAYVLNKEEVVLEKKKQPSVHDDYYDPMEDPTFDPHEAEATRGQSGRGTRGKMNVRKKYPVKEEKGCKGKGRHPRDQKELDRAESFIKKNPNFGKKVNEGVMKFIKDRVGGKKKPEKKAEMDKTTEKLHDLRREKFKTDKQKEHEKYVNFLPVDEEVVTELNRYGKETGKATGSLNKRPGSSVATRNEPGSAVNVVRRMIRKDTGRPEGQQKKVKGAKGLAQPGDRRFTPAQTISRMRAQVAAADAAMRDTRGT